MDNWEYHVISGNRRPASKFFRSDDSQFSNTDNENIQTERQLLLQDPQAANNYHSTGITVTHESAPAMEERETTDSGAAKPKSRRPASMEPAALCPLSFLINLTFLLSLMCPGPNSLGVLAHSVSHLILPNSRLALECD